MITVTAVPINPIPVLVTFLPRFLYPERYFASLPKLEIIKRLTRTISFVYVVHSKIYSVKKDCLLSSKEKRNIFTVR